MAAISLDDCTVTHMLGTPKVVKIVTPATADDGDTIDASSLFKNGCVAIACGATDLQTLSASAGYNTTITLGGSTDNEARTIIALGD